MVLFCVVQTNYFLQNFNPDVKERASIYVPAIGKVTIVMLLRNLVRLVQNRPRQQNGIEAA
jgi:methylenetetrahydrofolate dehydrogenase (NAD+)